MELVSQNSCSHRCALLIVLLLVLFGSALVAQAQNSGDLPNRDEVKPDSSQITEAPDQSLHSHFSAAAYMRLTADKQARRWLASERSTMPAGPAPSQNSNNGTYVFPTAHERFKHYLWDTAGPWTLLAVAGAAGIDQWENNPPEWRQGASGYGKRFASNFGQNVIQQTTIYGLSEALHVDSSFIKSNKSGFGPRLGDALLENVTSRTRNGKRVISAPRLAGFYVGGIVPAMTWYPSRFNYKDGLREGTYAFLFGFATNVVQEFILHR